MNPQDFSAMTAHDLQDPSVTPETLGQLANARQDLWPQIRQHPNIYPELATWLDSQLGAPQAAPQQAQQTQPQQAQSVAKPTEQQWAAEFQATQGREPTMSEYQQAREEGVFRKEYAAAAEANVRQFASSVSSRFNETRANLQSSDALAKIVGFAPIILSTAALLALISLMLPVASASAFGFKASFNFFSSESDMAGMATFMLLLFLATIGFCAVVFFTRTRWAIITAGVVGSVAGLTAMFVGLVTWISVASETFVSVGAGVVLLSLMGFVIIAGAVAMFLNLRQPAGPNNG